MHYDEDAGTQYRHEPPTAFVTVTGGVAEVAQVLPTPDSATVHIVDFDNLKDLLAECIESGKKDIILAEPERGYIKETDPDFYKRLEPFICEKGA